MTEEDIKFVNDNHKYKIWQRESDNYWCTYVRNNGNKQIAVRKTKDSLMNYLLKYYTGKTNANNTDDNKKLTKDFSKYKEINVWNIRTAAYLISPVGDVYSTLVKRWLSTELKDKTKTYPGNKYVSLVTNDGERKWFSIPRLVCAVFNGLPSEEIKNPSVDHIDCNPTNNYYTNLRWIEHYENSSIRPNRGIGESNSRAILTEENVIDICNELVKKNTPTKKLAEKYGVSEGAINAIKAKKNWYHITRWFNF